MKKTYKYLITVAFNGLLCLFVAASANAQHRDGGSSSGGGSGGGGSHPSGGSSGGGGGARPASAPSGGGARPSFNGGGGARPSFNAGGGARPSFNGGRTASGVGSYRPGNGGSRVAIAPPHANVPGYTVGTAHRSAIYPGSTGGSSYANTTARSYVGTHGYIGAGGRASVGAGGRGFYGPSYWRNNNYYHYHHGYYGTYYAPRLGFSIGFLPYGYYPFYYGDAEFYYSSGLFYQYDNNEYTVVEPPVGAEINTLPSNAQSIVINGEQYYEANGVYYQPITKDDGSVTYQVQGKDGELNTNNPNGGDQQQAPQVGDVVESLPPDCRKISLNGEKYYVSTDGYYYQDARDANNNKVYKIVGTPEDAPQNQ
jgi:hypothetical protein